MTPLCVKNPFSGETLSELPFATSKEISKKIETSAQAFRRWRNSSSWERSQLLEQVAAQLQIQKKDFADLICQEAGKPIQLALGEVDRAIGVLRWAASESQRFSGELLRLDTASTGRSGFGIHTRFPRGIILGITPYNFPLNLVMHKVAPAIATGCSILIKPSPFTPLTALKLASLFESIVPDLVQVLLTDDSSSAQLTQERQISMISFTGSARVGWMIRKQAPEKPTALELGGNAWVIVLEDTPEHLFPSIAKRICNAAYGYAGQSCISVQNAAIAPELWTSFQKQLRIATEKTPFGNPQLPSVVTGPMIHAQAAEKVRAQLAQLPAHSELTSSTQQEGSQASLAEHPSMIRPSLVIFQEEQKNSESAPNLIQEEIFAPVMTAQKFSSLDSVIQKINSSRYGLQAGVYTQNWATIEKLYRELEVGGVVVNDVPTTRYDHQPYGGVKDSGQGREGLKYAMEEMTESKFLALSSVIS